MKFCLLLFGLWALIFPALQPMSSFLLIRTLDVSDTENPNRFFLANAGTGAMTEILIERDSTYVAWSGWSPDGSRFAFLAPARVGSDYELWLANADGSNLDTPLLPLELNVVAARWNPVFNILAVATRTPGTPIGEDGLYLYNANADHLVFLKLESFGENSRLDWSRDAYWLAYTTAENTLTIVDTASKAQQILAQNINLQWLNAENTGWTGSDSYYLFTNPMQDALFALPTHDAPLNIPALENPGSVQFIPGEDRLLGWQENSIVVADLVTGAGETLASGADFDYGVLNNQWLVYNSSVPATFGISKQCWIMPLDGSQPPRFLREILSNAPWTHSRCMVLPGSKHLAVMSSTRPISWELLPAETSFTLYLVPATLGASFPITQTYPGFEIAPIEFSAGQELIMFPEGETLAIYNRRGERLSLTPSANLNFASETMQYHVDMQP